LGPLHYYNFRGRDPADQLAESLFENRHVFAGVKDFDNFLERPPAFSSGLLRTASAPFPSCFDFPGEAGIPVCRDFPLTCSTLLNIVFFNFL
jgi:hypothetical protein